MLTSPKYIEDAGIKGSPVTYSWKPYQGIAIASTYPKNFEKLVRGLTLRATLVLGVGIGEWLRWRLDGLTSYQRCSQYVEALWTRTVSRLYLKNDHLERPEDKGDPAIGALLALEQGLYNMLVKVSYDEPDRAQSVAELVPLVRYTMKDTSKFDDWLKTVLKRFIDNFKIDDDNRGGDLVPRAFLDPAVPIDPDAVPKLLDEQLCQIKWKGNPFLATPNEMLAQGFDGKPYRYTS